ncbi:MAG: aminofutalosine synthase MqnE [Planctomycetota bacterium]|nr:aminofutalosine synthase MqnE [Planctomycetota bacterium]
MSVFEDLIAKAGLADIHHKVLDGERLSFEDGVRLYECHDLNAVGHLANIVRERMNGNTTYFVRNQHINYTNVCNKFCKFCSFYALPRDEGAYTMSVDDVQQKVAEFMEFPVSEIHMVAGINPRLDYQYYKDIIRVVKETRPGVHVKAFTMVELVQIARKARKPLEETMAELKEAGLDSIPGGGAEIFSDRIQQELFPLKQNGEEWLDIAMTAHRIGLRSNATMLYGHIERIDEKVDHLVQLREAQDETGGFFAYIPLHFHPERTEMEGVRHATGEQDLREAALGRLMLDNFDHIKTFWVMITPQIAQVAQWYGADDIDGTIVEYEITRDPVRDKKQYLTHRQMVNLIADAGREPFERDSKYRRVNWDVSQYPGLAKEAQMEEMSAMTTAASVLN